MTAFQQGAPPPIHAGRRALVLAQAAIRSFETAARISLPAFP